MKKLFFVTIAVMLMTVVCSICVLSASMLDFKISDVSENVDDNERYVNFVLKSTEYGFPRIEVECYDENGVFLKTFTEFRSESNIRLQDGTYQHVGFFKIPDRTASLVLRDNNNGVKYIRYYEPVKVFKRDGTEKEISFLQLSKYLKNGWIFGTTMSMGGLDATQFSPTIVNELKNTGWETPIQLISIEKYGENEKKLVFKNNDVLAFHSYVAKCYDENGVCVSELEPVFENLDDGTYYITVPKSTAMLAFKDSGNKFYYSEFISVNSMDGREMDIFLLSVLEYEAVGWYPPETLYSADGRTIEVKAHEVSAYEAVGWYRYNDWRYFFYIANKYNEYLANQDYYNLLSMIDYYLPSYYNTKHESSFYAMRTQAMDLWRKKNNSPMAFLNYDIGYDYGTPIAKLSFKNISYKKIVAFKVKFDCYNIFGELERTYYDTYTCTNADMDILDEIMVEWKLNGAENVTKIKNVRVTQIVFEDGTNLFG